MKQEVAESNLGFQVTVHIIQYIRMQSSNVMIYIWRTRTTFGKGNRKSNKLIVSDHIQFLHRRGYSFL